MFKFFKKEQPPKEPTPEEKKEANKESLLKLQKRIVAEFKERMDKELSPEEKKPVKELSLENRKKLVNLGVNSIQSNPYFAAICLEQSGFYSEQEVKPLKEAEKIIRESPEKKRKIELASNVKEQFKKFAIQMFEKDEPELVKKLLAEIDMSEQEIESFLSDYVLRNVKKEN